MQRIIAYIYRYKGDGNIYRKCGNVGFCRVEEHEGRRIINMCFKETHSITKDCDISDLYLERVEDKNICRCKVGKKLRSEKICGGQMRIKIQGEKEEGLCVQCGEERYIVLWYGDKDAIILREESQLEEEPRLEAIEDIADKSFDMEDREERRRSSKEFRNKNEEEQLLRAYNRLAKVPMVIDNVMQQVAKIKPQQMIMLPRKYWRLTNNRFLMEGFYAHKHILFFEVDGHYVIGVPSVGGENENNCARKFGFESTLRGYDYGNPNMEKTYWLTYLN